MVQYVITPWRDRAELLQVKDQFSHQEPVSANAQIPAAVQREERRKLKRKDQHLAVARVAMWMQRGNCPHLVESTALLTAAVLSDEEAGEENAGSSSYALRAAYSAAFSRFVTGLLDGHQDKQRKQSMYAVAKTIGLPATFVELRHQSTHEQLPSLAKLRDAARKALDYIWDYYWKNLEEQAPISTAASSIRSIQPAVEDPCKATVMSYLKEHNPSRQQGILAELGQRWGVDAVEAAVKEVQGKLPGNMAWLKGKQLVKELRAAEKIQADRIQQKVETDAQAGEEMEVVDEAGAVEAPELAAFTKFKDTWEPKPIGALMSRKT